MHTIWMGRMVSDFALRQEVVNLLAGETSLDDFRRWLAEATWDLDPGTPAGSLASGIKRRLAEYDRGDLDRGDLTEALESFITHVSSPSHGGIVTGASNRTIEHQAAYHVAATSIASASVGRQPSVASS